MTRQAAASDSAKTQRRAPRERASSPSAPEPAKRSSTDAPSTGPTRLKSASRTRSPVGRVCSPFGAAIRRPRCVPAMMRIARTIRRTGLGLADVLRLAEQPIDGLGEQLFPRARVGELLRALEQVPVGAKAREPKVGQPRLARPDELALPADLEVPPGKLEA